MEQARVTFGVVPRGHGFRETVENAALAERLGFHSVWAGDHILWHAPTPEAVVMLSAFAARTERVLLGSGVLLAALRPPAVLAKQWATLDRVSEGRTILGVGIGGENPLEYANTGVPLRQRSGRLDETIVVLRRFWSGETFDHDGRYFHLERARLDLLPDQRPAPPIWVGGRAPLSLRRAGRLGDGWLGFVVAPERYAESWAAVQAHARDAGRDPDALTPALQVWTQFDPEPDVSRALLAPSIERMYQVPFERFAPYLITGNADTWAERIEAYVRAGVRHFTLILGAGEPREQIEAIARHVLPRYG